MTTTESPVPTTAGPTLAEQGPRLLAHIAGYVGHRTVAIGLRRGLISALAGASDALTPAELAGQLKLDPFYVAVWCRGAEASGVCEWVEPAGDVRVGLDGRYRLAPHMATLLLDTGHPGYVGGVFTVLEQPEVFDRFEDSLVSGERLWWDGCSPEWIAGVADTGTPFYTRLVPGGLSRIPELAAQLEAGCRVADTACGSGMGVLRLAQAYPQCHVVGIDGDERSLERAAKALAGAGIGERCTLVQAALEEMVLDEPVSCVINNISMHECRDIDRVTAKVREALEPGGWFVISDFPFPDTVDGLCSVPGRVMAGIQYFEAQIDDQLLPRTAYDELLARHGFTDVGHVDLTPVHAVTYGRVPR